VRDVGSRETRREANQKLFRLGNERLRVAVSERVPDTGRIPFLCECADEYCDERVELRLQEWESIAAEPNHYLMVAGHPRSEGEKVVRMIEGYDVVEKP